MKVVVFGYTWQKHVRSLAGDVDTTVLTYTWQRLGGKVMTTRLRWLRFGGRGISIVGRRSYDLETSLRATIVDDLHNPMPTSAGSISIPRMNLPKLIIYYC